MVFGINIEMILAIIIPPMIYAWIIYLSSPYKSLKLKDSFSFLVAGVFSITILYFLNAMFPEWDPRVMIEPFKQQFYTVAPKEEFSKFIMFLIVMSGVKRDNHKLHPISYMFYFGMVGLGFALVENIGYVQAYGMKVLGVRTFSSTIVHMICGLFFGYWIGMGNIIRSRFQYRSVLGAFLQSRIAFKSIIYTFLGFLTAVFYHGLWNYNLSTSGFAKDSIALLLLFLGLLMSKLLFQDLITQYRKSQIRKK